MKVKYVGTENGLFMLGKHFTKNVVVDVDKIVYDELKAGYINDFEFYEPVTKGVSIVHEPEPNDNKGSKPSKGKKTV